MVDSFGNWHEEPNYSKYPREKWCDYDHMAAWICELGYLPKTSMENLITMIFLHFDCPDNFGLDSEYGGSFSIDGCKLFVEHSGGLQEFDYES